MTRAHRYAAATAGLFAADMLLPNNAYGLALLGLGVLACFAAYQCIRDFKPRQASPWVLFAFVEVTAVTAIAMQVWTGRVGGDFPAAGMVLVITSLLSWAAGLSLLVRARSKALDRFQLLDLGIFLLSFIVFLKRVVLDPLVAESPPVGLTPAQSISLVVLQLICFVLIVRYATLPGRRPAPLWLLIASMVSSVCGAAFSAFLDPVLATHLCMFSSGGFGLVALACPSIVELTEPSPTAPPTFGPLRIVGFAAALVLAPAAAAVTERRTGELDLAWFMLPTVLTTVLVVARLRMLFERERSLGAERDALADRLRHQATHDALTGLPNRALFSDRLADCGPDHGVLFVDLDDFKNVNDSYGHAVGDHLLAAVAARLRDVVRAGDTVARLGGDEFAILVRAVDAQPVGERVVEALQDPFDIDGRRIQVGASVGVAIVGDTPDELLRNADVAMYAVKSAGKGGVAAYGDS